MTNDSNLFDPRFGKKPARFVGRDSVLRDIRAALADTEEQYRATMISGIKGSGKTSILMELKSSPDLSGFEFVYSGASDDLAEKVYEENAATPMPAKQQNGKSKVFMVDDASIGTSGLKKFLMDFSTRAINGDGSKIIIAGQPHATDELTKDNELSFLRKSGRITLNNVRIDEVMDFYSEVFADSDDGIVGRAAEATAGYPYMIQLIGYHLAKKGPGKGIGIDSAAVDKAIFLAKIELYKNIHEPLIWSLSSKDRMFLLAMAQDEGSSEFGEIAKRMNVSAGYASKYRERLINAGVIYSSAYGALAFTLPFMREYVEKEFIELFGGEGGKRRL